MDLFVELETLKLVTSATDRRELPSFTIKRGDALPLTLRFLQSQTPTRLDATTVITFALKESGKYDDDPVVLEQSFTASTVEDPDSDPHYTATPSLNTSELAELFSVDDDSSNDPASVTLMGELTWSATGDNGPTSIKTFSAICENDVYRGDEELLPAIDGDVPGTAASASLVFDNALGAAVDVTAGLVAVGDWSVRFWDGTTGSAPAEPYLLYVGGTTIWNTWVTSVGLLLQGSAIPPGNMSLVGTLGEHPDVTPSSNLVGDVLTLTLTAKQTGVAGNSITYSWATIPNDEDADGTLSGGVDARRFVQDDFVSTLADTLTTGQKAQAIANLIEAGSFNVGSADLETEGSGNGLVLESPDGSRWRVTVDNSGNLTTSSI